MKPYVACACVLSAECTAQVTDGQSTFVRVVNPSECEVCFCDAQGDVMAAPVVGIRQEGVNPCRMVPSMRDEVHGSCMTSRARSKVRDCELPCKVREVRVAALELHVI